MKSMTAQQTLNVSGGQDDSFGELFVELIKVVFNISDTNSTNIDYGYNNTTYYPHSGYGNYIHNQNHNFTHYNASYY